MYLTSEYIFPTFVLVHETTGEERGVYETTREERRGKAELLLLLLLLLLPPSIPSVETPLSRYVSENIAKNPTKQRLLVGKLLPPEEKKMIEIRKKGFKTNV